MSKRYPTTASVLFERGPPVGSVRDTPVRMYDSLGKTAIKPEHISSWDDFTFANLWPAFQCIFIWPPSNSPAPPRSPIPPYTINSANDVREMTKHHLDDLLERTAGDGARVILSRVGRSLSPSNIIIDSCRRLPAAGDLIYVPRLSVSLGNKQDGGRPWLVVGSARVSKTWHSSSLSQEKPSSSDLIPLHQLACYARFSNTPYAFIASDREVIVVRYFRVSENDPDQFGAEWKAIPWSVAGDQVLTGNLAIWCLIMMALNDNHRSVNFRDETLPINLWYREESNGVVHFRNHFSLRTLDTLPTNAKVVATPGGPSDQNRMMF
ncbi:uncharacterized protein DNG_04099 [Cephalotrichum gorgonifer]|uniref:Uncharacterized protein n=1 Tax=Cephalotrichum gorgonifer TaxID=2041049 RepID=A0AAE8SUV7_9PEZI|nr:uncharacterized protein DNG_04099 [Cephalotrichum gorgonifer]